MQKGMKVQQEIAEATALQMGAEQYGLLAYLTIFEMLLTHEEHAIPTRGTSGIPQ